MNKENLAFAGAVTVIAMPVYYGCIRIGQTIGTWIGEKVQDRRERKFIKEMEKSQKTWRAMLQHYQNTKQYCEEHGYMD
jgi:hypothetical protein